MRRSTPPLAQGHRKRFIDASSAVADQASARAALDHAETWVALALCGWQGQDKRRTHELRQALPKPGLTRSARSLIAR